jgi:hypothetical protein
MTYVDMLGRVQQLRTQLGLDATATPGVAPDNLFAATLDSVQSTGLNSTVTGTAAPVGGITHDRVVADARRYLGIRYVYGSADPAKGLDCSGLVQNVYKDLGVQLPRVAADQARRGTAVPGLAQAKPGDLVAFGSPVDHIGIYIGDNKMIVAPHTGDVVKVENVYTTPTAIRHILPDSQTAGVNALPALHPSALRSTGSALNVPYADLFASTAQRCGLDPALLAGVAKVESGYNPGAVSGAGGGAVRKYGGIPPYAETQAYVPKVQAAMAALQGRDNR